MNAPRRHVYPTILCMLLVCSVFAQEPERMRNGTCIPQAMRVRIDTLSIVPGTFTLSGADTGQYRVDFVTAELFLADSALLGKPLAYQYRTLGADYSRPIFHKSVSRLEAPMPTFLPVPTSASSGLFQEDEGLETAGFVSRGVTVGNRQDMALNSALSLQIAGKLSEDIDIMASISDKNVPVQPEGNTEYLTNINNIFLTLLYKQMLRVDAGDILMQTPSDLFLKANRSLLGMKLGVKTAWDKGSSSHVAGGGVTKGKYVRQTIAPLNGVQGPYRLYGENGETSIVVVAGSERVYMDGVLLVRGQENDYTIDYNTAEITFTPAALITAEKRVVVEFECTDRHYSRYGLFSYNEVKVGDKRPLTLRVNFCQEQDMRNQSVQPELTDIQKLFLSEIGDMEDQALFPSADSAAFSADRVLYCKKDTVVDGVRYGVFEYSTSDSLQLYGVSFTYMGSQKGSYRLLSSTVNGRVFGWVAPRDGVPQGDYEPVVRLTTPKLVQMATIAADYQVGGRSALRAELALSNYDRNTFSSSDDRDNVGFACFLAASHEQPLRRRGADTSLWRFKSALQWQFVHRNFHVMESFREVEFARNYNLDQDYSDAASEQMLRAVLAVTRTEVSTTQYSINWFSRIGDTRALRQELQSGVTAGHVDAHTQTSWLCSADSVQTSSFVTSYNRLSYRFRKLEAGASDRLEHNLFRDARTADLRLNSYAFNEASAFLRNTDSLIYKYNILYKNRLEYVPQDGRLKLHTRIHEAQASFSFDRIKNQHFCMRMTYRNQRLADSIRKRKEENMFVGNAEYSGRFWRNSVILRTYYEMGDGMELKRNYTFIKVAAGQGTHVWKDYNGNGVEELEEFEVAAFQDEADYVKVWLTGTDYVCTYNAQLAQSVQLRPAAVWRNRTGFRCFLSRFSNTAMLRTQAKHSSPVFNPIPLRLEDTALVSHNLSFNNTFSFNNSSSKFAFDVMVQEQRGKELLYYGSEYGRQSVQQVVLKSTPHSSLFLQTAYQRQVRANLSEMMASRCYTVVQHTVSGNMQLQFANTYFASVSYAWSHKRNLEGIEFVRAHDLKAAFNLKMPRRGVLSATLQYVGIKGEAPAESAVSYQLLDGLSVGRNVLWGLDYQCSVTDYLQVSLQYEGRKAQGSRSVHNGGLSVKAHF